jgi:cytochrome P450
MGAIARAERRYHYIQFFERKAYTNTARTGRSDLERLRCHSVAPDGSFIDVDLVGRAGLMLTASSGTVTLSPSGLFALFLSTPDRSLREE